LYLSSQQNDLPRARDVLERAIALRPTDPFLHRLRVSALLNDGTVPGAVALAAAEENAARFPRDAVVQYHLAQIYRDDGRLADMETRLDRAIDVGPVPVPNALVWKAQAALWLRGDVAEMTSWLDRMPARHRTTERVVVARWAAAMAGGRWVDGIDALATLPQDWVEDWSFNGPKHLLSGQLLALQGDATRARLHFEHALAEVQQRAAREPSEPGYRGLEAWIQLGLGRTDTARELFREYTLPTLRRPHRAGPLNSWWFRAIPCSLLLGERATALELIREAITPPVVEPGVPVPFAAGYEVSFRATAAELRAALQRRLDLDPRMAPWRDDPEIVALLAPTP
jgi:tetratricopeptide (TPR) repeat protein